ncbi:MAG: polyribonucleotide nucleotidyltransferase [Holosporales bacterium]|jgi:polyribonucleotide nucleotidyltransferase|nr:polyribonucleotide nucleotidyltransferase [Holosporales bacterium]
MFSIKTEKIAWAGRTLSLETGKIARQADGAVVVRFGDTIVLCTVVFSKKIAADASFFPLTINYQERFYAAGKIPGGFLKREGKPSDREVLISRLIDRPIRPLFPSGFLNEVQIVCTVLSYSANDSPEIAAMIGASAALGISGIPFLGPIAACKVGYTKDDGYILNPTQASDLDLVVAGTRNGILMVESEACELPEDIMLEAVMFGFRSFQPVLDMIENLAKKAGKPRLQVVPFEEEYRETLKEIENFSIQKIRNTLRIRDKLERSECLEKAKDELFDEFGEKHAKVIIDSLFEHLLAREMRETLLQTRERIDGRKLDQIRSISCEIDFLPKVHGSALFTRGETQAIVVSTLGSSSDEQIIDDIVGDRKERFMLHYNFPPYATGETGRIGAPGRREIGHGKLAWRALNPILPSKDSFPYSVRIVSDVTGSNGSSSMATVCGASLSMMAAGIPLKAPVAGIAVGLIKSDSDYIVLSDIMGDEDHLGDMDFKVAGTEDGITALQMDIKIPSISEEILRVALDQARVGRLHILGVMQKTISRARNELNENAPRTHTLIIGKDKIRDLIGTGGKTIKEICERTKAKIDIDDNGVVSIFSPDKARVEEALQSVKTVCCPPDIGSVFTGRVTKITDFGAFVSIGSKEGLVHISNIANLKVSSVASVLHYGQEVRVKVIGIDEKDRIKLSMKDV